MRILALSNFYPPYYIGGYELGCQQVMERLAQRGHDIAILTSTFGVEQPVVEGTVYRQLRMHPTGDQSLRPWSGGLREYRSQRVLQRLLRCFRPQGVILWNMSLLSASLAALLQARRTPTIYAISDFYTLDRMAVNEWFQMWNWPGRTWLKDRLKRLVKRGLASVLPTDPVPIPWEHCFFTSEALRRLYVEAGRPAAAGRIIYWGVDPDAYHTERPPRAADRLRVLYAGRLDREKGVDTLLEALRRLPGPARAALEVSLAGEGSDPTCVQHLHTLTASLEGKPAVRFLGKVGFAGMPALYRTHDVLVFPSAWEEPFSVGLLEAMAAGLCVVGTTTGGSKEILEPEVNSLTFRAGDAAALARQLQRVIEDPPLRQRLATAGLHTVQARFGLDGMVDEVERFLQEVRCQPR